MTDTQPSFTLTGQVALITASSRGIGKACALALAQAGADIILGLKHEASGQALVTQIQKMGREVLPVQMDVTRLDEIAEAVRAGMRHFKRIDILVNNAGIGAPNPAEQVTEKDFDDTLAVNLKGTFFTAQSVGREMIRQRRGRIINISSQAGFVALPNRIDLLHDKGGHRPSDQVPGTGMGALPYHGKCRCAHFHYHAWHKEMAG